MVKLSAKTKSYMGIKAGGLISELRHLTNDEKRKIMNVLHDWFSAIDHKRKTMEQEADKQHEERKRFRELTLNFKNQILEFPNIDDFLLEQGVSVDDALPQLRKMLDNVDGENAYVIAETYESVMSEVSNLMDEIDRHYKE